jgi:pyridoxine kinase
MARVLILSSWVAHGHVGASAAGPALQALGHAVTVLPTTILSNHPGWPHVAGRAVPVEELSAMADALDANGWLAGADALLTGYLPSPAHVAFAAALARRARPSRLVVDPILGDTPGGLYQPREVARALRDTLVPEADILTPNAFELGWLTGRPVGTPAEIAGAAAALAGRVLVTSVPGAPGETGVMEVPGPRLWRMPRHEAVPHGPGDVFAGLVAAGLDVSAALGHLQALVEASLGADHLEIPGRAADWTAAPPLAPVPQEPG